MESESLLAALLPDKEGTFVISIVGAGGKTSILWQLAKEYEALGRNTIVTTTTHIYQPTGHPYTCDSNILKLQDLLLENKIVCVGEPVKDNKLRAVSDELMNDILGLHIPVLIEADGAKGFPCKAPAEHEPVIRKESNIVIGVIGIDCIGKQINKVCHRPEKVAAILNKKDTDILSVEDLPVLIHSKKGLKKGILPNMRFILVINKIDSIKEERLGKQLAGILDKTDDVEVIFTSSNR